MYFLRVGLSRLTQFFLIVVLIAGVVSLQLVRRQQLQQQSDSSLIRLNELYESNYALKLSVLRVLPKFGYENLFADWTFLNFLQYFGTDDLRRLTGYNLSTQYFGIIVDSDPRFVESYVFLTNSISLYAGQPQESVRLIEKGLASMTPDTPERSFYLWRHKAIDELLLLGDTQAARQSYQMATEWAEQSLDEEASLVAKLSRQTAQFLAADPNSRPARISAWSDILLRATDDIIRQKAIGEIEALGGTVLLAENGQVTVRYKLDDE